MKYETNHLVKIWLGLAMFGFSLQSYAGLKVIGDFGGESAVRYYEALQPDESMTEAYPNAVPTTLTEADILPVVSHRLTVGKVFPARMDLLGMQPIFLIGADNTSVLWLQQNAQRLVEMNAIGLVVNVKTIEELTTLRAVVPSLTLIPTPGDDLAQRLGLSHYPVLLSAIGISQ